MSCNLNEKKYHNEDIERNKKMRAYEYFFRELYLGSISCPITTKNLYESIKR